MFQKNCPSYTFIRDLGPKKAQEACNCMYRITAEKWPDMATLLAAMPVLDREPRGETDFVPSAIRMAAPYCMRRHGEKA